MGRGTWGSFNFRTPVLKRNMPPKSVPVREFINGKPAERLYFQSQKKVRESELNLNLPP